MSINPFLAHGHGYSPQETILLKSCRSITIHKTLPPSIKHHHIPRTQTRTVLIRKYNYQPQTKKFPEITLKLPITINPNEKHLIKVGKNIPFTFHSFLGPQTAE